MPQDVPQQAITASYVDVTVDEQSETSRMRAYMARPQTPGNYPGIIIGFELFGITSYIRAIVERLARQGYVVLAPDFYHRSAPGSELNATPEGRARGFVLLQQLTRQQAIADVRSALNYLRDKQMCQKIGMMGLSVGGHIAYLAATQCDLQATVAFYPGWLTAQEIPLSRPTSTLSLTPGIAEHGGYLLLLVGEQDHLISLAQRESIVEELQAARVRHELVVYPDAPHRFFCEEGEGYRQIAAQDAWHRVCNLFASELAVEK